MRKRIGLAVLAVVVAGMFAWNAVAVGQGSGAEALYTLDADFEKGTLLNVNHDSPNNNQLQLNTDTSTFPFIWVALSARGTIAKIDTRDGTVLGEFSSTSDGDNCHNVSRTTVTTDGSAFAGNRCQSSVIHVGLEELNQCIDRNSNGSIETSSGYGDVLAWPGGSNSNSSAVSNAADECVLHYTDTIGGDARHVTANAEGDVWVGGCCNNPTFTLIDKDTGSISRTEGPFAGTSCGGYGGVIDGNGTIWSATSGSSLLRWEPDSPQVPGVNPRCLSVPNYGLAVDSNSNVWVTGLSGNQLHKVSPDGNTVSANFNHGSSYAQGVAVDGNDHVWTSSSLFCSSSCTLGHNLNDGSFVGNVSPAGNGSTGVAVDAAGKIWTANINGGVAGNGSASRYDPAAGPAGAGGVPTGAMDLEVQLPGAGPYNYSDMTGSQLLNATAPQGTWTVVQDAGSDGAKWGKVVWNTEPQGSEPGGTQISFEARAAANQAGLGSESFVPVSNNTAFSLTGRFIEVRATLKPNDQDVSPVLSDVRICTEGSSCIGQTAAAPAPSTTPAARRDRSRPRVVVAGVARRGCVRRAFNAKFRIRESNLRSVSVFLDGKRVARTSKKLFSVRVPANRMKAGRHRLRVVAVDRSGNRRSLTRVFARCAQARAPVFTG